MNRIKIALTVATLTLASLVGGGQPAAQAHEGGYNAHADEAYPNADHVVFDKGPGVGDNWQFVNKMNDVDDHFFPDPQLVSAECENTAGPCLNVSEVCFENETWMIQWDRDYFGGVHGRVRLNHCTGNGRDVSAVCRVVLKVIGSHSWHDVDNGTCLDEPWRLGVNHAKSADYDALNLAYGYV